MDYAEARRLAQEAVKEDPEFALALPSSSPRRPSGTNGSPISAGAPGLKEVEAAEARANRLPEKERLTLRMFRALVDRRLDDAARLSEEAVAAYPLDKDVLLQAGDVLFHWEVNLGTAVQYFERALQLDPVNFRSHDHLLDTVWWTGQSARFLPFIEQRAAAAVQYDEAQVIDSPTAKKKADELDTVAVALLAAGKEREGIDAPRSGRTASRHSRFRGNLWYTYLYYQGRMAEAEAEVRAAFALFEHPEENPRLKGKTPPVDLRAPLSRLLASGRMREANAAWEGRTGSQSRHHCGDGPVARREGLGGRTRGRAASLVEKGESGGLGGRLGSGSLLRDRWATGPGRGSESSGPGRTRIGP